MTSTADTSDVVEIDTDGVSVTKSYAADEFPVPAIKFEITSEHDEPVAVRLTEDIPESFPMDGVGFHPEYHSDQWTAFQDNRVEFRGTVDPDESLVTVYGVRLDDESDVDEFLTEPSIAKVQPGDSELEPSASAEDSSTVSGSTIDDITASDGDQAVKDMLSGETDSVPGLGEADDADEPETGESDEAITVDAGDESADGLDLNLEDVDTEPVDVDEDDDADDEAPDIEIDFDEDGAADDETGDADETSDDDEPKIELDLDAAAEAVVDDDAADDSAESADDDAVEASVDDAVEASDDETGVDESEVGDADADEGDADADDDEGVDADAISSGTDADEPTESDRESTLDEGAEETPAAGAPAGETGDGSVGSPDPEPLAGESVASALVEEIRDGEVADRELDALRDALDVQSQGSERARIDHLQSRVDEVAAYASALEEFLDEEGTGQQLIEEFQSRLSSFESDLSSVSGRLDETESTVATLQETVQTVESDLEGTDEAVGRLDEDVDEVTTEVDEVSADVAALDDDVSGLEADVDDLGGAVDALDDDVEDLDTDVDALEEDVSDLDDELDEVREQVTDIVEWRNQLGSMFSD